MIDLSKEKYQEQMNELCQKNTLSAEDILKRRYTSTPITDISHKRRKFRKIIVAAAVMFVVLSVGGTTALGAMGEGPLANVMEVVINQFFRKANDTKTNELIDQGYYYEMDEQKTDGIFTATFLGVSGDKRNPMLMLKLHIEDDEITSTYDKLKVTVYPGIGKEEYETARLDVVFPDGEIEIGEHCYGYDDAEAVQDPENPKDYYITTRGCIYNGPVIVALRSVIIPSVGEIRTDIEFETVISFDKLKPTFMLYCDRNCSVQYQGYTFYLTHIDMNGYSTGISIHVDDIEGKHSNEEAARMQNVVEEMGRDLRIVADGVEYSAKDFSVFYYDRFSGPTEYAGCCWVHFDPVPYDTAEEILITYQGRVLGNIAGVSEEIDLKTDKETDANGENTASETTTDYVVLDQKIFNQGQYIISKDTVYGEDDYLFIGKGAEMVVLPGKTLSIKCPTDLYGRICAEKTDFQTQSYAISMHEWAEIEMGDIAIKCEPLDPNDRTAEIGFRTDKTFHSKGKYILESPVNAKLYITLPQNAGFEDCFILEGGGTGLEIYINGNTVPVAARDIPSRLTFGKERDLVISEDEVVDSYIQLLPNRTMTVLPNVKLTLDATFEIDGTFKFYSGNVSAVWMWLNPEATVVIDDDIVLTCRVNRNVEGVQNVREAIILNPSFSGKNVIRVGNACILDIEMPESKKFEDYFIIGDVYPDLIINVNGKQIR